jgi:hypothetical protein
MPRKSVTSSQTLPGLWKLPQTRLHGQKEACRISLEAELQQFGSTRTSPGSQDGQSIIWPPWPPSQKQSTYEPCRHISEGHSKVTKPQKMHYGLHYLQY